MSGIRKKPFLASHLEGKFVELKKIGHNVNYCDESHGGGQAVYIDAKKGGLVADVQGRQYAPAIARQGEPATRLAEAPPEPPKASVSVAQMPASPVKQAPKVASLTVGGTSPGLPTTAEQQAFEMRLRKQLAEIRARASMPGPALPMMNSVAMVAKALLFF